MKKSMLLSAIKGVGIGILVSLILLLLGNLIALNTKDPDGTASLLAHIVRLLGGFAGGFAASRFQGERGLITGAITGGLYLLLLMLGAVMAAGGFRPLSALLVGAAVVAAASVGGLLGLPGETSASAKRRALQKRMGR